MSDFDSDVLPKQRPLLLLLVERQAVHPLRPLVIHLYRRWPATCCCCCCSPVHPLRPLVIHLYRRWPATCCCCCSHYVQLVDCQYSSFISQSKGLFLYISKVKWCVWFCLRFYVEVRRKAEHTFIHDESLPNLLQFHENWCTDNNFRTMCWRGLANWVESFYLLKLVLCWI